LRLATHAAVGAGVAAYTYVLVDRSLVGLIIAVLASLVVNILVDAFGHHHRLFKPPRRTKLTHSLPGIVAISLAISYLSIRGVPLTLRQEAGIILAVLAGGLSHWLLDALTPSGVYVVRRRVRIARIPYWSTTANTIFQMIGGALLAYSLYIVLKSP